jgi:hypothetical protein
LTGEDSGETDDYRTGTLVTEVQSGRTKISLSDTLVTDRNRSGEWTDATQVTVERQVASRSTPAGKLTVDVSGGVGVVTPGVGQAAQTAIHQLTGNPELSVTPNDDTSAGLLVGGRARLEGSRGALYYAAQASTTFTALGEYESTASLEGEVGIASSRSGVNAYLGAYARATARSIQNDFLETGSTNPGGSTTVGMRFGVWSSASGSGVSGYVAADGPDGVQNPRYGLVGTFSF